MNLLANFLLYHRVFRRLLAAKEPLKCSEVETLSSSMERKELSLESSQIKHEFDLNDVRNF